MYLIFLFRKKKKNSCSLLSRIMSEKITQVGFFQLFAISVHLFFLRRTHHLSVLYWELSSPMHTWHFPPSTWFLFTRNKYCLAGIYAQMHIPMSVYDTNVELHQTETRNQKHRVETLSIPTILRNQQPALHTQCLNISNKF